MILGKPTSLISMTLKILYFMYVLKRAEMNDIITCKLQGGDGDDHNAGKDK